MSVPNVPRKLIYPNGFIFYSVDPNIPPIEITAVGDSERKYINDIRKKWNCEYCKGFTNDDKRGNCIACGAPRKQL